MKSTVIAEYIDSIGKTAAVQLQLEKRKPVNIKLTSWYRGEERIRTADLLTASQAL